MRETSVGLTTILLLLMTCLAGEAVAQNADYLWPRAFKNWIGFFAKHHADTERCTGHPQPGMRDDFFQYIDKLYVKEASDFKADYDRTYTMYATGSGRGRSQGCNQRRYDHAQKIYEQRATQLATFRPPPASTMEADARVSGNIPDDEPACIASPPGLRPNPPRGQLLTLTAGDQRWSTESGSVSGGSTLQIDAEHDGTVYAWLNVYASSNAFKLYGDSTAIVIFANSEGKRIWNPIGYDGLSAYVSQLAMAMGSNRDQRQRRFPMMYKPECDAAYAFLKTRFCGMEEAFERYNKANSCPGEYQGPDRGRRQIRNLDSSDFGAVERHLQEHRYAVGEKFQVGAWQGVRVR